MFIRRCAVRVSVSIQITILDLEVSFLHIESSSIIVWESKQILALDLGPIQDYSP